MPALAKARGRAWAGLVLLAWVAAFAVVAAPASAQLGVEGGARDLGDLARSGAAATTVTVRNGAATDLDVTVAFEGDGDSNIAAEPAMLTVPAGGAAQVDLTLTVDADAAPGRHENAVVIAPSASGAGSQAIGAARITLVHRVAVVDVAFAGVADNGTVFLRIVNGHPTVRTVASTVETLRGAATIEALGVP